MHAHIDTGNDWDIGKIMRIKTQANRKDKHQRIAAASVGLDVDLLMGNDAPLTIEMAEQGGRTVPRISIAA